MSGDDKPRLGRPLEVVRAEILSSPEAQQLAKTFGVSIEVYADMVLEYVKHPDKEPQLDTIDEEDAEEEGVRLTTPGEVKAWLEGVASGDVPVGPPTVPDGFAADRGEAAARFAVGGIPPAISAPREEHGRGEVKTGPSALGSVLRDELKARRDQALTSGPPPGIPKPRK